MIEETLCELIINRYYDTVYNLCFARLNRNRQAAEDCTQETFLTFFSKRGMLEFTDNIQLWLYRTAEKVIKSYIRRNKQILIDVDEVADKLISEKQSFEEQSEAFDCLSEEEKELLTIYYDYEYGERIRLAEEKGLTQSALYNRVYRIKQKLYKEYNKS